MSTNSKTTVDWQVETIRAFVMKQKQDRYVEKSRPQNHYICNYTQESWSSKHCVS